MAGINTMYFDDIRLITRPGRKRGGGIGGMAGISRTG